MTDKETLLDHEALVAAIKAAGWKLNSYADNGIWVFIGEEKMLFNSYTSNADCFRLETALKLNVDWGDDNVNVYPHDNLTNPDVVYEFFEDHNGDKDKARRYASTRAAALRGRE